MLSIDIKLTSRRAKPHETLSEVTLHGDPGLASSIASMFGRLALQCIANAGRIIVALDCDQAVTEHILGWSDVHYLRDLDLS